MYATPANPGNSAPSNYLYQLRRPLKQLPFPGTDPHVHNLDCLVSLFIFTFSQISRIDEESQIFMAEEQTSHCLTSWSNVFATTGNGKPAFVFRFLVPFCRAIGFMAKEGGIDS